MKHKGFTLVELMVVVTIAGILLGMALFSVGPMIARMNANSDAKKIAQLMRDAQEKSISKGIPVMVTFTVSGTHINALTQYLTNPPTTATFEKFTNTISGLVPGSPPGKQVPDLDTTIAPSATGIGFTNGQLLFNPSGGTTTPQAIYIYNRNIQCAVSVNANGRVRDWKWRTNQWSQ